MGAYKLKPLIILFTCGLVMGLVRPLAAGEKEPFRSVQKYITGAGSDLGNWEVTACPMSLGPDNLYYEAVRYLQPGLTYYYKYTAQYTTVAGETKKLWEQVTWVRSVYVPYGVTSLTVNDNWSGVPRPPANLRVVPSSATCSLEWTEPTFGGEKILDIAGYLIYRSTNGSNYLLVNGTTTLVGGSIYSDTGLTNGTTYFYKMRTVDAYDNFLMSEFSNVAWGVPGPYLTVVFHLTKKNASPEEKLYWEQDPLMGEKKLLLSGSGGEYQTMLVLPINEHEPLRYHYISGETPEPDPLPGQPYREVLVRDNGKGVLHMYDFWGVPTVDEILPEQILVFKGSASDQTVTLTWEQNPFVTQSNFLIYRSSTAPDENYALVYSTGGYQWVNDGLTNNVSYYYKIACLLDGTTTALSKHIMCVPPDISGRLPDWQLLSDVAGVANLETSPANETGMVELCWTSPGSSQSLGPAHHYVVLTSTCEVTAAGQVEDITKSGRLRASYPGTKEDFVSINYGETCPSFYFTIMAFYGNWTKATISKSALGVAGYRAQAHEKTLLRKGSRGIGAQDENTGIEVDIPAQSLPTAQAVVSICNRVEISKQESLSDTNKAIETANSGASGIRKLVLLKENQDVSDISNTIVSFSATDAGKTSIYRDANRDGKPDRLNNELFTISIPFADKNRDGILDYSEGDKHPVKVSRLRVYRLNEENCYWEEVRDGGINEPDINTGVVRAEVRYLSIFCLLARGQAADDLSNVVVYPNPWRPYDGKDETGRLYSPEDPHSGIIFTNLTENTQICVYNIAGELVRYNLEADDIGEFQWSATNDNSYAVASGLYIFVAKDDTLTKGQKRFIGKLGIIR